MSAIASLGGRLRAAAPRERRMLQLAAGVIVAAAMLSLFEWSETERDRLARALPTAEARLARMQDQAEELARLNRFATPPTAPVPVRADAARAAAAVRALSIEIELTPEGLAIAGSGAAAALLDWLASMQAEQGLRPVELEITRAGDGIEFSGRLAAIGADRGR